MYCFKLGNKKSFFFFLFVTLTTFYFFVLFKFSGYDLGITYFYYLLLFVAYHTTFTFSKLFWLRTLVIIRGYLNKNMFFKLFQWFFLIFLTALLADTFIIFGVLSPVFILCIVVANHTLVLFLFLMWCWMFFLVISNKFNLFTKYLENTLQYFSRRACLHFVGNGLGTRLTEAVGGAVVLAPVTISVTGGVFFVSGHDDKAGNFAFGKMVQYREANPLATYKQQYNQYVEMYNGHANSSLAGRTLNSLGLIKPAVPEAIIPNYNTGLKEKLASYR